MTAAEDRELRDRIDVFSDRESKCSHSVELAKSNYAASKAAYEVRLEAPDTREMELRARHQRTAQVVLSIALPLISAAVSCVIFGVFDVEVPGDYGSGSAIIVGIVLILSSLVFSYGAELEGAKA